MPAHQRSLELTSLYRVRLQGIQTRLEREIRRTWAAIDPTDIDATYDAPKAALLIQSAQRQGITATTGYLTAFLTSEIGTRVAGPTLSAETGTTRAGRDLSDASLGAIYGVKALISEGKEPTEALSLIQTDFLRLAGVSADWAARSALTEGLTTDDRFKGWKRAVRGTCGACLGAATGSLAAPDEQIDTHPGCQCIQEPAVAGVPDKIRRPSGHELFENYSEAHQNELFGKDKADLLRSGAVALTDLVDKSHLTHDEDYLTETPLAALTTT